MAGGRPRCWRHTPEGLLIAVRLTPRSAADRIEGLERHGDDVVLKARVRAVPEKGRANAALEKLIARALGVPASRVAVQSGGKSRLKSVAVTGEAGDLEARLMAVAGPPP